VDLQKKLGISALDPQHSMIVQEITNLEKGVSDATQQRVLEEARYTCCSPCLPTRFKILQLPGHRWRPESADDPARTARVRQRGNGKAAAGLWPNYPAGEAVRQIQAYDHEIAKQERGSSTQAKDATGIAQAAESKATGMLGSRVHELYGQRDDLVQYELLSQEYESNRHMYESILARLREAAVDAGLDSADISIVDLASLPVAPSSMPPATMGMLGLFFGALGGLAFALLLERLDTRLRDSGRFRICWVCLPSQSCRKPTGKPGKRPRTSIPRQPPGRRFYGIPGRPLPEAMRVFRTSIQLSSTSRQSRVIAVTKLSAGRRQVHPIDESGGGPCSGGKRVVVVDTDMRRPSLLWRLKLTGKRGLSEYLTGAEPWKESSRHTKS